MSATVKRFYISATDAPSVSPSYDSFWTDTSGAIRRSLSQSRFNSAFSVHDHTFTYPGFPDTQKRLMLQLIAEDMPAIGSSVGFLTAAIRAKLVKDAAPATFTSGQMFTLWRIFDAAGSTELARYFTHTDTGSPQTVTYPLDPLYTHSPTIGNSLKECHPGDGWLALNSTSQLRKDLTYSFTAGDVLVVEIGLTSALAGSGTWTVSVEVGDDASSDFAATASGDTAQRNPWVDLYDNAPYSPGGNSQFRFFRPLAATKQANRMQYPPVVINPNENTVSSLFMAGQVPGGSA